MTTKQARTPVTIRHTTRIAIDAQALQGENWDRGIGRYTYSLITELSGCAGTEITLLVNSSDSLNHDLVDQLIESKGLRSIYWTPIPDCSGNRNKAARSSSSIIYERVLLTLNGYDALLIPSICEGYVTNCVVSVGHYFRCPTKVVGICHDIIPTVLSKEYLSDDLAYADWYWECIGSLQRCDHLLTVSKATQRDLIDHIRYPASQTNVIYAGIPIPFTSTKSEREASESQGKESYYQRLSQDFILAILGDDRRKNIEGAVKGYALAVKRENSLMKDCKLLIVGGINSERVAELRRDPEIDHLFHNDILLAGRVSDEDLEYLRKECLFLLFPSLYEGFGLPIIEAYQHNKRVVTSNCSSMAEISVDTELLCDPHSKEDIAEKILNAMTLARVETCSTALRGLRDCYGWRTIAREILTTVASLRNGGSDTTKSVKARLAWVSPLPPEKSGISYYTLDLSSALVQHYDCTFVCGDSDASSAKFPWLNIKGYNWLKEEYCTFDYIVYNIGNSSYHIDIYEILAAVPGVVVLHDVFVGGIFLSQAQEFPSLLIDQALYSHGLQKVQKAGSQNSEIFWNLSSNRTIIERSLSVSIHSQHAHALLEDDYRHSIEWREFGTKIKRLFHPRNVSISAHDDLERRLNDSKDDSIPLAFVTLGIVGESKLTKEIIRAWIKAKSDSMIGSRLIIAGGYDIGFENDPLFVEAKRQGVEFTGWLEDQEYTEVIRSSHIAIQLRRSSRGETSGTVLDCLSHGLPVITCSEGALSELPEDVVSFIGVDENIVDSLVEMFVSARSCYPEYRQKARRGLDMVCTSLRPIKYISLLESILKESYKDECLLSIDRRIALAHGNTLASMNKDYREQAFLFAKNYCSSPCTVHSLRKRRILVECTMTETHKETTGIQRVVNRLIRTMTAECPQDCEVLPVRLDKNYPEQLVFAAEYAKLLFGLHQQPSDFFVEVATNDILLLPDLNPCLHKLFYSYFKRLERQDVSVWFVVHDLIAVTHPEYFRSGAAQEISSWLIDALSFNGLIAVSETTKYEALRFAMANQIAIDESQITTIHLAGDIDEDAPTFEKTVRPLYSERDIRLLMVGTIEPRKGHLAVLKAIQKIVASGDYRLDIVGKMGWLSESDQAEFVELTTNIDNICWHGIVSDSELAHMYASAHILVLASYAEGFGLPLIEALKIGCDIVARDIPIFREVVSSYAEYSPSHVEFFLDDSPEEIVTCIQDVVRLGRHRRFAHQHIEEVRSWKDAARDYFSLLLEVSSR